MTGHQPVERLDFNKNKYESYLDRFVMMTIHIAHEEVENREIHDIQKSPALVVGLDLFYDLAVIFVGFPGGFPPLVVRTPPRMAPSLARGQGLEKNCHTFTIIIRITLDIISVQTGP